MSIKNRTYSLFDTRKMMRNVAKKIVNDSNCRIVYPVGNCSSGIFFIGEAPGAKEDEIGEPFVGASGRILNNILLPSVGLNRDTIYLTNIVKCRPPNNRDPLPSEKKAWSDVLTAEILAVKPRLLVCLGRHSLGFFFPTAKISKTHGTVEYTEISKDQKLPVLALYHPAVGLYNPKSKEILKKDFLVIKRYLDRYENDSSDEKNTIQTELI